MVSRRPRRIKISDKSWVGAKLTKREIHRCLCHKLSPPSKPTGEAMKTASCAFVADCKSQVSRHSSCHRKYRGQCCSASPKGGQMVTQEVNQASIPGTHAIRTKSISPRISKESHQSTHTVALLSFRLLRAVWLCALLDRKLAFLTIRAPHQPR